MSSSQIKITHSSYRELAKVFHFSDHTPQFPQAAIKTIKTITSLCQRPIITSITPTTQEPTASKLREITLQSPRDQTTAAHGE